jgi:hypothetical protein
MVGENPDWYLHLNLDSHATQPFGFCVTFISKSVFRSDKRLSPPIGTLIPAKIHLSMNTMLLEIKSALSQSHKIG